MKLSEVMHGNVAVIAGDATVSRAEKIRTRRLFPTS